MTIRTNVKQHELTKSVLLKQIEDEDLLKFVEDRFDKILRSCQEFDEKLSMVQKSPYLNPEGRLFETEKSAQPFVKAMRDLQSDTTFSDKFLNRKNHLLDGYEMKSIEPRPENANLYTEIRQRIINREGADNPQIMQSAFTNACLLKQTRVAAACLDDPFHAIDEKMKQKGQATYDQDINKLVEKDPLLQELGQAHEALQSIARSELGMLEKAGIIDSLKVKASGKLENE